MIVIMQLKKNGITKKYNSTYSNTY